MQHLAFRTWIRIGLAWLLSQTLVFAQDAEETRSFPPDQLEQLVAPIALYPDSLVAQILMASTYPLEIVQAARWRDANPAPEGDELEKALADQRWDPSVKALTNFPDVLKRMSDNLDWTQDLGDAVLAQEQDVMDAVQRMRRYAYEEGNLKTSSEQVVTVKEKIIVVEPATKVVYVPAYNPVVVYGSVWAPPRYYYPVYSYPPSYWYPPGYTAARVVAFGVGMAITVSIWNNWNWGHCDWHRSSITINNNFNFSRNVNTANIKISNKGGGGKYSRWEHQAEHRGGVRYRDQSVSKRYDKADRARPAKIDRDTARGYDRAGSRDVQKPKTRDVASPSRDSQRPSSREPERPQTRDRQRPTGTAQERPQTREAQRPQSRDVQPVQSRDRTTGAGRHDAFDVGSAKFDRAASNRGAVSRGVSGGGRLSGGGAARGGGRLGR